MTLYVETTGSGPALVMLHGWGLNGRVWDGVRDALASHFTLHIVDLPGHGRSGHVRVDSFQTWLNDVAEVIPDGAHLMGWSLGGHTALALAARFPQKVARLITICCTPRFVEAPDWPQGKRRAVLADFARRLGSNYAATIRNFLALQALNQPAMRDTIRTLQDAVPAHGAPSVEALGAALSILETSDIRAEVVTIQQPTLVIQGDHDALTSTASADWLRTHVPHSTYVLIEHAAHAPFLSHRDAFMNAVLKHLRA
jgi:pimeloyl-[acyl-carrier protein] methyl ester esterase